MQWDKLLPLRLSVPPLGQVAHSISPILSNAKVITAIGATTVVISAYSYIRLYRYRYWTSLGIDGPPPSVPFGNMLQSITDPLKRFQEWQDKYGPTYGVYIFTTPFLVCGDVNMLKELFVDDNFYDKLTVRGHPVLEDNILNKNGLEWRHDRSILSPSFTSGKMKLMLPLIDESIDKYLALVQVWSATSEQVSPKATFTKLTSMIIARCAFATQVDAFAQDEHPLMKHLLNIVTPRVLPILIFSFTPAFLKRYFKMHASPSESFDYITHVLKTIIQVRKNTRSSDQFNDLLQLLINAQNEGNNFSDDQIIANSFIFFIAGLETTAFTLSFICYSLARHPDVQEKLYQEIKDAHDASGFTYDTLFQMKYLDAVINETLRLYSPGPQVVRSARNDYTFSNQMKVRGGTSIIIPIHAIHRNSEYHPRADVFDPSRFLPDNKSNIVAGSWIPFFSGPRNCVGMRFAQLVLKSVIARTVLEYQIVPSANTPTEDTLDTGIFNSRADQIKISFRERLTSR